MLEASDAPLSLSIINVRAIAGSAKAVNGSFFRLTPRLERNPQATYVLWCFSIFMKNSKREGMTKTVKTVERASPPSTTLPSPR